MLRKTYDKTMELAAGRFAVPTLFGVSFAESSFFPIPPDALLIPMVLSKRAKWLWYVIVCTVASVLGGVAGYLIGYFLFTSVAEPIISFYGYGDKVDAAIANFNAYGAWIIFLAGFTPIPYKVFTIMAGASALSMPVFVVASIVGRGARFLLVGLLLYHFGPPIRALVEKRLALMTAVGGALAVAGFAVLKLL